ncbi:MAG: linear amide C-N hydrolase [Chthoniobacterales bacterium]
MKTKFIAPSILAALLLLPSPAEACSRALFKNSEGKVLVGRSMDWMNETKTDLYAFPRGLKRNGGTSRNTMQWTSKYGSLICSFYGAATVDGINEKGLVANVLYLSDADYGSPEGKPTLNIAAWAQYVLDNYATVAEAVSALEKEPLRIVAPILPGNVPATGHLSISDPTGDSAIFEYIKGKLVVHHGPEYKVMTNEPTYDEQLAIDKYWQEVNGDVFLPGTSRPSDRFARASYYISRIPGKADPAYISGVPGQDVTTQNIASVLGVIRDVSVPLGISTPGEPNVASTTWRTVADQTSRTYYFDSATSPNIFWVELGKLQLGEGAPVKKLTLAGGQIYSGETSTKFEVAEPFAWLPEKAASAPAGRAPASPAAPSAPQSIQGPTSATKGG